MLIKFLLWLILCENEGEIADFQFEKLNSNLIFKFVFNFEALHDVHFQSN